MGKFILDLRGLRLAAAIGLALLAASPAHASEATAEKQDTMIRSAILANHAIDEQAAKVSEANVDAGSLTAVRPRVNDDRRLLIAVPDEVHAALAVYPEDVAVPQPQAKAEGGLVALKATGTPSGKVLAEAENIHLSADAADKIRFTVAGDLTQASTLNRGALQEDEATVVMTKRQASRLLSSVVNCDKAREAGSLTRDEEGNVLLAPPLTPKSAPGEEGAKIVTHLKERGTPEKNYKIAESDPDIILDAEAWVEGPG